MTAIAAALERLRTFAEGGSFAWRDAAQNTDFNRLRADLLAALFASPAPSGQGVSGISDMTQQDTQPPAETLAEAREAAALAFDARARKASHPEVVALERHHAKVIRAGEGDEYDAVQAALIALTRHAGGDAIPAGWQLMPVALTDAMREAATGVPISSMIGTPGMVRIDYDEADAIWSAMQSATPKPPAGGDAAEMAAFGASDAACTLYPGEDQAAERAAFIAGAALALPAPVVEGEVDGVPKGMKRAYVRCRTHDRVAHYDYVPYSFSTAVAVMPCGCDTKHADRITHEQFVAATPVQTGGKPGWDEDGICNDHGRELCADCARTPATLAALSEGRSHG